MGLVWLGALLYKMGKVRVLYRKPQPNTTTHINQHEPPPSYPPVALPSLSTWAEQSCPQIIVPLLPHECAQVVSRRACARCRWFACLGGQNERHQKIERGGSAVALGGCHFINYTQQSNKSWRRQWMGSHEGRATGAERVGGRRIFALVVKLINKN